LEEFLEWRCVRGSRDFDAREVAGAANRERGGAVAFVPHEIAHFDADHAVHVFSERLWALFDVEYEVTIASGTLRLCARRQDPKGTTSKTEGDSENL
jgi:hypothetical protein